jgi:RNA polymerase sigma factor (sigma-70 family)
MRSDGREKMNKITRVEDVVTMCERLARKIGRPQHYEDLVSEGILKSLELLADAPDTHPANVYRAARKRMYDYLAFDCHGLSVPASDAARAVARGNDITDRDDYSERGIEALKAALTVEPLEYDDDIYCGMDATPEQLLIDKQTSHALTEIINEHLTEEEAEIIILRFFEEATQEEVADLFSLSQKSVSIREKKALRKIRIHACNNL